MNLARVGSGIFLLWVMSGCAAPTPRELAAENQLKLRQEIQEEVSIGREMAAKLLGKFGSYKNPQALEYLNLVGHTLARQVGRPELQFKFAILDTADKNAYACPGGFVLVTRGLMQDLHSESELSGVVAHEIAHVNAKHMYEAIRTKREITWAEIVARMFTHGYGDLGASLSKIVEQGYNILTDQGYGMDKELEADRAAATYASSLGYDAFALPAVLRRLEKDSNTEILSKTHPNFSSRIKTMSDYLKVNGLEGGKFMANSEILGKRFSYYRKKYRAD